MKNQISGPFLLSSLCLVGLYPPTDLVHGSSRGPPLLFPTARAPQPGRSTGGPHRASSVHQALSPWHRRVGPSSQLIRPHEQSGAG
jgi:hypothetical protein